MNRTDASIGGNSSVWKAGEPFQFEGPDKAIRNQRTESILWDDTGQQARARPHRALGVSQGVSILFHVSEESFDGF